VSLYNMVMGTNSIAGALLAALELSPDRLGRPRDAWLDGEEIVVLTRCGGGNRDDYEQVFEDLRAHPCYLRDEDDDYDSTYALIHFRFPEQYAEPLREASRRAGPAKSLHERWEAAIAAIKAAPEEP